ncbi:zinc-binding alcohol dehydrogenase family protein [Neptunicella marina]|uniref:Zinc-type alcohol dehydrogenase-like protein n=1 Tax=Neptunicella marina TaxID=2125989 RepID=A0A8J6ITG2_9ALTE|nr:zinc-binding alcohol dehydrogenase family protein [Neptunicella marina]MBC3765587.1 zinc-binding alcohol dehydrogenase family protein [Neptunicella marina]
MQAVGYQQAHQLGEGALNDIELPVPQASAHDLLVEVSAVSVNPVDTKIRKSASVEQGYKVLGWDAVGTVKAVGEKVTLFKPGDRVWYAGDITRQGSNAQFQLVDERIVSLAPNSLSDAQAAALPLTSLTAWEMLFDRLQVKTGKDFSGESLLVIGAAGGVGSILVQLARKLTGLTVIGTASREETRNWLKELGVHHVIDHSKPLSQQLKAIGFDSVTHVVSLTNTDDHFDEIIESLAPQGKFGLIDDPAVLDATKLKRKSLSLHWELMFTRSLFQTADMLAQHHILSEVAALIDEGIIKTTLGENFGEINAANITKAHQLIESQQAKGKIVLQGFAKL